MVTNQLFNYIFTKLICFTVYITRISRLAGK